MQDSLLNLNTLLVDKKKPNTTVPAPVSQVPTSVLANNKNTIFGGKTNQPKSSEVPEYDFSSEVKTLGSKPLVYDSNKTSTQLIKEVSTEAKINPRLLYSSAWIEGMNKGVVKPDDASEAYVENADKKVFNQDEFPVDGFYNYGLDTFGNKYEKLKKYLPAGFESRFHTYDTTNEKNEPIKTAAFKSNKDALLAKTAMLKAEQDDVNNYAKSKGIQLDPDASDYFTMSSYNGGFGNAKKMLDEYSKAKDKKAYIDKGLTSKKAIHKNVMRRMNMRGAVDELIAKG